MAAPQRVSDTKIREAIQRWRGNVRAAAEELGMAPKSLYQRIETLGIDLAAVRAGIGVNGATPINGVGRALPMTPMGGGVTHVSQSRVATFPRPAPPPTLPSMTQGSAAATVVAEVAGLGVRPKRLTQPRHAPEVLEIVADGRRQLAAACGLDMTDAEVFEAFVKDEFQQWLAAKIEAVRAARGEGEDR